MFFTIEGIEGSGKSSIIKKLEEKFLEENIKIKITSEPKGSDKIGSKIKEIILEEGIDPLTEFLLFSSFRNEHIKKFINHWVNECFVVISDRFIHSSIVYQGFEQNVNLKFVECVNDMVLNDLKIDRIFLIDLNPNIAKKRIELRNGKSFDKFDNKPITFHQNIRKYYLELSKNNENMEIINGDQPIENIVNLIFSKIKLILENNIEFKNCKTK